MSEGHDNHLVSNKTMDETYEELAHIAIQRWQSKQHPPETTDPLQSESADNDNNSRRHRQLWIALAGAPGSGKTTTAQAVVDQIHQKQVPSNNKRAQQPLRAIVIPMDGYHYPKSHLQQHSMDMKRRGAPWTFDAEAMVRDLRQARSVLVSSSHAPSSRTVSLPGYLRDISDPVPNAVELSSDFDIVIIEGLYVLLGCLGNEDSFEASGNDNNNACLSHVVQGDKEWETRSIRDEIARWKPLLSLWDDLWFVAPRAGLQENQRRLVERSLRTWTLEKTAIWGGATQEEAVQNRVSYNDFKNALLVDCCRAHARVQIESV